MAYSIPEYVDTPEQAILAVASAVKGEQVTGGDGNVGTALDILADALAGENVQVPMTQQGAILALAQYVDGMVKPEGTVTITENGEGIDVAQYATADVSVSGGGGDVSTATVTYTLTGGKSDLSVEAAIAVEEESVMYSAPNFYSEEASGSFTVLLFGGNALVSVFESTVTVVSGDVEVFSDHLLGITGDCTITVASD